MSTSLARWTEDKVGGERRYSGTERKCLRPSGLENELASPGNGLLGSRTSVNASANKEGKGEGRRTQLESKHPTGGER